MKTREWVDKPDLKKVDLALCIDHKKNPNPNGPGELYSLGNKDEVRRKAHESAERILAYFRATD